MWTLAEGLALLQWQAMLATVLARVLAASLVASSRDSRRHADFSLFLFSTLLWVARCWHTGATARVVLRFGLAMMNMCGARKTDGG